MIRKAHTVAQKQCERQLNTWQQKHHFSYFIILSFEHNHTPSEKKIIMVTGVEVVTASQVQNIGCRWQAIRAQTLTKTKAMGMKGVVSKGERQRVK